MDLIQSCQNLKSYLKSSDVKNNLDPGRATMVVVYIYGYPGRFEIDNFFSYLTFVTASSPSKHCMRRSRGGRGKCWSPSETLKKYNFL